MMDILKRLDLNLLIAFDILLDERSVTRAAARLSLSQPATSAALARLRASFNDQLLIRSRGEMFLTERASALRQPIKDALRAVAQALEAQDSFRPEAFDGRFRLAMTDIASFTLGSDIVQDLRHKAPSAAAEFIALDRSRLYDWFRNDMIDAAVVVYSADEGLYESEHLFDDELIFVASKTHPLRHKRAQAFSRLTAYPLIEVSIATTIMRPFFEEQEALGHKWSPMVSVPQFLIVPSMLQDNDCIGVMGRLAARKFEDMGAAVILEISEPTPVVHYRLIWHKRRTHDPAHRWMRDMIGTIAAKKR
ncbi:MAG TPA: LysR family transcriptional regulator [Beijerinckiaceae bacterium]|jgi:DNA-binding transcriptional LysR family regulator|nr:LysR family transcriptional regulator [Beijerinckiaceae bacterium]